MILNSPYISGSITVTGNSIVSGSITVLGGLSGSSAQSASYALSASYAISASNALAAQSASYVLNAISASYAASASNALSASNAVTAQTASYANTFTVASTLTAQTLVVQTITSSVDYVTGSTRFGSLLTNTHVFSGSVTMNSNGLFVSSSGNVGIGTINPLSKLHINTGVNQNLRIRPGTDVSATNGIAINSRDDADSALQQLSLRASDVLMLVTGNVGIGLTNPADILHVQKSSTGNFDAYLDNPNTTAGNGVRLVFRTTDSGGTNVLNAGGIRTVFNSRGVSTVDNDIIIGTRGGDNFIIKNNGNVGIGYTSPAYNLQVLNTIGLRTNSVDFQAIKGTGFGYSPGSYKVVMLGSSASADFTTVSIGYDPAGNANGSFSGDGREILFRRGVQFVTPNSANNNYYLTNLVLQDGNVGIGTASPSAAFHTEVNSSTFTARIINTNTTTNNAGLLVKAGVNSGNEIILAQKANGTSVFLVDASGNVGIGTTGPVGLLQVSSLANTGGGMLYKNQNITAGTATTFFTTNNIDGWCGFAEIFGVCSVDRNRVFYKLARFAYNRVWTEMISSEQNTATTTLSYSGNDLTINIGGTAGLAYYCMIRVVGSTL